MAIWEREIFEKEYADMNWYKGKQAKHVKEMEVARKRAKLGISSLVPLKSRPIHLSSVLTKPQREIFDEVKAFVLENRGGPVNRPALTMPNDFSARERAFVDRLAEELHLGLTWDEYDEEDVNVVTWRLPEAVEQHSTLNGNGVDENVNDEDEWEDEDDEESHAAVDRVLQKYEKAQVMDEDADGGFDARYEQSVKLKMDEWKREYYRVCCEFLSWAATYILFAEQTRDQLR
jgi:5'-3' exoribonuclease 1